MPRTARRVKACPNCGSPEIEYASLDRRAAGFTGLGLPERYYCKYCGYHGSIILETTTSSLRKMRFPRKRYIPFRPERRVREAREIAGPVVLGLLVVFLIASALLVLPKREVSTTTYQIPEAAPSITVNLGGVDYDVLYGLKRTITGTITGIEEVTIIAEPEAAGVTQLTIITMNETSLIQRATGIGDVTGYWVYLALLFFVFGFAIMGAWCWWRKTPLFH